MKKQYVIVNHQRPDWDSVVTTFMFMLWKELDWSEVEFKFIPPGTVYETTPEDENKTIIHLDVSNICVPENGFFDHHNPGGREKYPSAASLVWEYFQSYFNENDLYTELKDLIHLTNQIDSGHKWDPSESEAHDVKKLYISHIQKINQEHNTNLMIIPYKKGPHEVSNVFHNYISLPDITDIEILKLGYINLKAWYFTQKKRIAMHGYFEKEVKYKEHNGIKFLILPANCPFEIKDVRYHARRFFGRNHHILIGEYIENGKKTYGATNISFEKSCNKISGFEVLYNLLFTSERIDPQYADGSVPQNIYLDEPDRFVLYIRSNSKSSKLLQFFHSNSP